MFNVQKLFNESSFLMTTVVLNRQQVPTYIENLTQNLQNINHYRVFVAYTYTHIQKGIILDALYHSMRGLVKYLIEISNPQHIRLMDSFEPSKLRLSFIVGIHSLILSFALLFSGTAAIYKPGIFYKIYGNNILVQSSHDSVCASVLLMH